jgi:hypothetical protein
VSYKSNSILDPIAVDIIITDIRDGVLVFVASKFFEKCSIFFCLKTTVFSLNMYGRLCFEISTLIDKEIAFWEIEIRICIGILLDIWKLNRRIRGFCFVTCKSLYKRKRTGDFVSNEFCRKFYAFASFR